MKNNDERITAIIKSIQDSAPETNYDAALLDLLKAAKEWDYEHPEKNLCKYPWMHCSGS